MSVRIKWDPNALYNVRRDPALIAMEEALAREIANRAMSMGKGTYAVGSRQGLRKPQGRWRTSVVTADAEAIADNARRNVLIRAMT